MVFGSLEKVRSAQGPGKAARVLDVRSVQSDHRDGPQPYRQRSRHGGPEERIWPLGNDLYTSRFHSWFSSRSPTPPRYGAQRLVVLHPHGSADRWYCAHRVNGPRQSAGPKPVWSESQGGGFVTRATASAESRHEPTDYDSEHGVASNNWLQRKVQFESWAMA